MASNEQLWSEYKQHPTPELKKQIILNYVNLVHYVIHNTNITISPPVDERDIFQFGVEGLSDAIDHFDPDYGTKFETYAIQRVRGKIFEELRKSGIKQEHTEKLQINEVCLDCDTLCSPDENQSEQVERKELKHQLLELIRTLDERERTILSFYYYEELNYREIAQVLNITVSRVSQIHSKIIKFLKTELEKQENTPI